MGSFRFRTRKAPSRGTRISMCSACALVRLAWYHLWMDNLSQPCPALPLGLSLSPRSMPPSRPRSKPLPHAPGPYPIPPHIHAPGPGPHPSRNPVAPPSCLRSMPPAQVHASIPPQARAPARPSLFALVRVGLRHRLREAHLKFVAAQGDLLVVRDEVIEGVEDQVVRQEELGGARVLPGVDPAVLDFAVPPEGTRRP